MLDEDAALPDTDNDAPDSPTPLGWLAHLSARGDITPVERDAGELLATLGAIALSGKRGSARVSHSWRYANGVWSIVFSSLADVVGKYEAALEAANNDTQRRALVSALVARTPQQDHDGVADLQLGLRAVARHWWGATAAVTTQRNGVTLARTAADPANSNTPTPERIAQNGAGGRDNFERLLVRGQIDEDKEVAVALYAAGLRYETEHQMAFGSGFGSPDYSKPIVDGGGDTATPITERAQHARTNLRKAREAMGRRYADVVDAVVLHGMSLVSAGRRYTPYRGVDAATTAAKERLNGGLRALAVVYGVAVRRAAA